MVSAMNPVIAPGRAAKISVIIPCHNYGRFLSWAITSVLHQSRVVDEILVIDDASTDDTADVAAIYKDKIKYVRVDFNCAQQTRNYGIACAIGEYVLFLDADDFLDNHAVEILERELDADAKLKLVYSGRYNFGLYEALRDLKFDYAWVPESFSIHKLHQYNYISMPSMFRRASFPGFDSRIKRFQDWDAWLSFLSLDTDAKLIPYPLHHVRFHGMNKTLLVELSSERFKVMAKHGLLNIRLPSELHAAPVCGADERGPIRIFLVARSPSSAPVLNEFIKLAGRSVCGMLVGENGQDVSSQIEASAQALSIPIALERSTNLDVLMSVAVQQMACREADWLVVGDFSTTLGIEELLKHNDTAGSVIVTVPSFDWTLGLSDAPFVAFNHRAAHEFFSFPPITDATASPSEPHYRVLRSLSDLWGRHIGWRLRSKVEENGSES